jgi:hypothetical protein
MLFECIRDGQNSMTVNGDKLDTLSADVRLQNAALQLHPACGGTSSPPSEDSVCDETDLFNTNREGDPDGFDP